MTMIREATSDDVPRIVELVLEFIRTTPYAAVIAESPERIAGLARMLLDGLGVIYVAELNETAWGPAYIVGFIAIAELEQPLTGIRIAEELAWFIDPNHRSGRAGYHLLRSAEAWARQKGLHMLKMVAPSNTDVGRFYSRVGYAPLETAYIKQL